MFRFLACILVASTFVATKGAKILDKRHGSTNHGGWAPEHCWDHAPNKLMDPFCALLNLGCDDAPEILNGRHGPYNKTYGSTVNYVCNDGYIMHGNEVIKCETTDPTIAPYWTTPPTCIKGTCSAVPEIENGYHEEVNSTNLGTTVQYFCNNNYIMDGNDTIACMLVGNNPSWTQPTPKCRENTCRLPLQITNGYAVLPNPLYVPPTAAPETTVTEAPTTTTEQPKTTVTVPSPPDNSTDTDSVNGTALSDNSTDTISVNGTAVSDNSTDTLNDADNLLSDMYNFTTTAAPDFSNDTSTDEPITANTTDTITDIDTTTTMPVTTTLATTTTPPPVTISPFIPVTNETVFQINDTIIYQCNAGYGFVTKENTFAVKNSLEATCISVNKTTTWSSTVVCVPDCMSVPDVRNANYTEPSNTLQGSSVTYACFQGFEMIGAAVVTCLSTGNWSELPYCKGCQSPPEIENGSHDKDYSTSINSTVSYLCNDGYSMIGSETITCESIDVSPYAKWTDPPKCTTACGPVPSITSGEHTVPDNFLVGANVTYSCLFGATMSGSPDVVCQASGNWSKLPVCEAVCVNPPNIPHSIPTRYTYNETDTIIVTCEEHYTLVGNNTLECIGGNWTTPFPICECVIKPIDIVFLIDGSGSLGLHGFRQTLGFVVDLVKRFPEETTNFGLVTFASNVLRQFYLNEYVNNTAGMIERIQNTTYPTGGTYTYSALTYARTQMFQEQNGMRPNVSHTAIIVTDGQSNNFNETVHQAELLKAEGVTIYSVGVGLTNQDELNLIASKPEYVFTVDNYDLIDQIAGPLAGITCSSTHGSNDDGSYISE